MQCKHHRLPLKCDAVRSVLDYGFAEDDDAYSFSSFSRVWVLRHVVFRETDALNREMPRLTTMHDTKPARTRAYTP